MAMEQLDIKIIKKRIQQMQAQNATDLEAMLNMAKLRHDYQKSQLDNIIKLCDQSLKLRGFGRQPEAEPSQENGNGSLEPK